MTIWKLYEIFTGRNIFSDIYENKSVWYLDSSTENIAGNLTKVKDGTVGYVFSSVGNLSQNVLDFTHLDFCSRFEKCKKVWSRLSNHCMKCWPDEMFPGIFWKNLTKTAELNKSKVME